MGTHGQRFPSARPGGDAKEDFYEKRTLGAYLLALALALSLLPTAAWAADDVGGGDTADDTEYKKVYSWETLIAAIQNKDVIRIILTEDVKCDAAITISRELTIYLDDHTLTGADNGSVITVKDGGELTIQNSANGDETSTPGTITGGSAVNGGGIYIEKGGTVIIKAGVEITGNKATGTGGNQGLGGGVYNAGTFKMDGGAIYGNSAKTAAADFYNAAGGTFTLVPVKGYTWYEDRPGNRYPEPQTPYKIPETGSEGTRAETWLAAEVPLDGGDGSKGTPYLISDAAQLAAFRDIVNGNNGGEGDLDACAKLTDDINLGGTANPWTPIGPNSSRPYSGTFDGKGHTISDLYCDVRGGGGGEGRAGLFGIIDGGEVRNLNVEGSVSASGGTSVAGGICGYNLGTITGCTFSGSASASISTSASTAGGVCGTNQGTVENCRNDGSVTAKDGDRSLTAGGVCGQNSGTVTNCLNTGKVTAKDTGDGEPNIGGVSGDNVNLGVSGKPSTVTNCLNTGKVTAETTGDEPNIGGVCGYNDGKAAVTKCYWLDTTCDKAIGGEGTVEATSKTDVQLASGEVAYLLNNSTSGEDVPWRQNLDNGKEKDPFPVLDDDHDIVHPIKEDGGIVGYSNYQNGSKPDTGGETGGNTGGSTGGGSSSGGSHRPAKPDGPSTGASDGWKDIREEIRDAEKGDKVTIDMNGETEVPGEVFEEIAGRDVTVAFQLEDGVSWTVNGEDVPADAALTDLDLGVRMDTRGIPVNVFNAVTGEYGAVQFTLAHDGPFGFALTLSAPLGRGNAGYWANLYYYHERGRELEFRQAAQIGRDGTAAFRMDHASQYAVVIDDKSHEPEPLPFTDVPEGHWAYDAIQYVCGEGLMAGTGADAFSPQGTTTRAQIVTILWRLSDSPVVNYLMDFDDVAEGQWYTEAVRWAVSEGIAGGYGGGLFGPGDPITREQFAVMLWRYAQHGGYDTAQGGMAIREYADYDEISGYALEAMDWAVGAGIISGTGESALAPGGTATRAQAAVMLERFCQLNK